MGIIAGKKLHKKYRVIDLEETIGKTVEAIAESEVPGAYGPETSIRFLFTDGTMAGIVIASDD